MFSPALLSSLTFINFHCLPSLTYFSLLLFRNDFLWWFHVSEPQIILWPWLYCWWKLPRKTKKKVDNNLEKHKQLIRRRNWDGNSFSWLRWSFFFHNSSSSFWDFCVFLCWFYPSQFRIVGKSKMPEIVGKICIFLEVKCKRMVYGGSKRFEVIGFVEWGSERLECWHCWHCLWQLNIYLESMLGNLWGSMNYEVCYKCEGLSPLSTVMFYLGFFFQFLLFIF